MTLAVIMKLRKQIGLLMVVIVIALISFLLMDALSSSGNVFGSGPQNVIGEVNGKELLYDAFNQEDKLIEKRLKYFQGYGNTAGFNFTTEERYQIRDYAWSEFVLNEILKEERKKIGIDLQRQELDNLILSPRPSQEVLNFYTQVISGDPAAPYDPTRMQQGVNEIKNYTADNIEGYWIKEYYDELERVMYYNSLRNKYSNLFQKSIYIPDWKAEVSHGQGNNSSDIQFIGLNINDINDSLVEPTEEEMMEYLKENNSKYESRSTLRGLQYVIFDIFPTEADSNEAKNFVLDNWAEVETTGKDSVYINRFSETKYNPGFFPIEEITTIMADSLFAIDTNESIGPYIEDGKFRIAKLYDRQLINDSVQVRHVFAGRQRDGALDSARELMDSVKTLFEQGVPFDTLVLQFSQDPGTRNNGGDLGFMRPSDNLLRGIIHSVFFDHTVGEAFILESGAGVHFMEITGEGPEKEMIRYGIMDRQIRPGSDIRDDLYTKVSRFYTKYGIADSFEIGIEREGHIARFADNLQGSAYNLTGISIPARNMVRWAFQSELGDIKLFDEYEGQDNKYVVAKVIKAVQQGESNLESTREDIRMELIKQKKSEMLKDRITNAMVGAPTLDQVAAKLNTEVKTANGIKYTSQFIEGAGAEPIIATTASALSMNSMSEPVIGNNGVYLVFKTNEQLTEAPQDNSILKSQVLGTLIQRFGQNMLNNIRNNADISDERYKYY